MDSRFLCHDNSFSKNYALVNTELPKPDPTDAPPILDFLQEIEDDPSKKNILKAVRKTLGFMETNLRHPSLSTHEFISLKGPNGEKVFEAYVQQKTPSAYRIFWYYGPGRNQITIVAITPHP